MEKLPALILLGVVFSWVWDLVFDRRKFGGRIAESRTLGVTLGALLWVLTVQALLPLPHAVVGWLMVPGLLLLAAASCLAAGDAWRSAGRVRRAVLGLFRPQRAHRAEPRMSDHELMGLHVDLLKVDRLRSTGKLTDRIRADGLMAEVVAQAARPARHA